MPDNLTTWRMDARAISLDILVGQVITDLVSTKPLLIRPQTPRFFVVGDQTRLGAAIHNNTTTPLVVDVAIQASGLQLQSPMTQQIEIPANSQAAIYWEAMIDLDAERVDLVFSASGTSTDGARYEDASRPTQGSLDQQGIPVYRFEVPETIGTSGQLSTPVIHRRKYLSTQ